MILTYIKRLLGARSIRASPFMRIAAFHAGSRIPVKRKHQEPLLSIDKIVNNLAAERHIVIEHINAVIKVFKVMTYPYRNHRRRRLLRMSLICGIINFELKL
jgi:hypothetical protein